MGAYPINIEWVLIALKVIMLAVIATVTYLQFAYVNNLRLLPVAIPAFNTIGFGLVVFSEKIQHPWLPFVVGIVFALPLLMLVVVHWRFSFGNWTDPTAGKLGLLTLANFIAAVTLLVITILWPSLLLSKVSSGG